MHHIPPKENVMNNPSPTFTGTDTQQAFWFLGSLVDFRVIGADTGDSLAVLEHRNQRGYAPPVHRHLLADETVVVLEGEMRAEVGGESFTADAGGAVFLPRLIAHSSNT
jgi:quercetin dioxygenase-like cupin family protein